MTSSLIRRTVCQTFIAIFLIVQSATAAEFKGIHTGFARVPAELLDQGELLLGELNCVACHEADAAVKKRLASKQAPLLGAEGVTLTAQFIRRWLANPDAVKPGNTMPDLLHELDQDEQKTAIEALVHFLVSETKATNTAPIAADEFKIQQGRFLYHQIGCVACHAPQEPALAILSKNTLEPGASARASLEALAGDSIPLGDLSRKTDVASLARFLKNPLKMRPSGRMPSLNLTDVEATAISMYLLRAQIVSATPNGPRPKTQGVSFEYFEGRFNQTSDLDKQKPISSGIMERFGIGDRKNKQYFGLRLSAVLKAPQDGVYAFYTDSDDGSRLFLDGKLVVDNDKIHGPTEEKGTVDLNAGEHPIVVTFFNEGAGASLKVSYEGPGISKREIPTSALSTYGGQLMQPLDREDLVVDEQKAIRGRQLFGSLGCAACHTLAGFNFNSTLTAKAKTFSTLAADQGCLAEKPAKGIPNYNFSKGQRETIQRTLARRTELAKDLPPVMQVNHALAAMNCFACHSRAGYGGPSPARAEYFSVIGGADLGDEGRIPPHLTRVGDKLRPEWTREVLVNKAAVRPYMAARMPQFGDRNVGGLPTALEQADSGPKQAGNEESASLDAKFGRNLVGTGGLACISCHTFGPHKSLGIPALDLTQTTKRLKKDWFHRYLLDPPSLRPGTRMPSFWPEGKSSRQDILAGNTDRQIDAIWAYLARGKEAGLPPGLIQGKMEIVAATEPVIYRHFIQGAGTRAIGVGYPEKANLAFDANEIRLALIWQGSFIDAARHRTGRGDGSESPLGYNTVRMPPGPAFAILESPSAEWPTVAGKKGGYQMHGYTFDQKRRPSFRYSFQNVEIEDTVLPMPGEIDSLFRRTIVLHSEQTARNLWFRAWSGAKVEEEGNGVFLADGKVRLKFEIAGGGRPIVRQSGGHTELLVPVSFIAKEARLVEEITW